MDLDDSTGHVEAGEHVFALGVDHRLLLARLWLVKQQRDALAALVRATRGCNSNQPRRTVLCGRVPATARGIRVGPCRLVGKAPENHRSIYLRSTFLLVNRPGG